MVIFPRSKMEFDEGSACMELHLPMIVVNGSVNMTGFGWIWWPSLDALLSTLTTSPQWSSKTKLQLPPYSGFTVVCMPFEQISYTMHGLVCTQLTCLRARKLVGVVGILCTFLTTLETMLKHCSASIPYGQLFFVNLHKVKNTHTSIISETNPPAG